MIFKSHLILCKKKNILLYGLMCVVSYVTCYILSISMSSLFPPFFSIVATSIYLSTSQFIEYISETKEKKEDKFIKKRRRRNRERENKLLSKESEKPIHFQIEFLYVLHRISEIIFQHATNRRLKSSVFSLVKLFSRSLSLSLSFMCVCVYAFKHNK